MVLLRWEEAKTGQIFWREPCTLQSQVSPFEQDENVLPAVQGQRQGLPHTDEERGLKKGMSELSNQVLHLKGCDSGQRA